MTPKGIGKVTAVLGLSALLLSGCGLFGPAKESMSMDPPQLTQDANLTGTNDPNAAGQEGITTTEKQGTVDRMVYLLDNNGFVVPVSMTLPKSEGAAKQVLAYMVKGGPVESLLPEGFHAILPEGTKVIGLNIKNGTATVDFSKEFKKYQPSEEKKIIDAVTRSLTEFQAIKNISIWVNGKPVSEMPSDHTPVFSLNRDNGINVELADHAIPGRTTPVTLYFQAQANDKKSYFVPVTRLIPQTEDVTKAVVEELIKGPKSDSQLFSSFMPSTKVLDVKNSNGTVVINLSKDVLKFDNGKEANPEAMESLVLSLTENTGVKQVQVMVEGKPLTAAGSMNFTKPVSRPIQINAMPF
ncbi:GerMN domain-containing protein [Brevibacillus ginsengisoli]|uniref:GerMN domain-containing protein n=1 Tax=Brevibacillus ginsengisoli TaxID=363854 RepID=UPI003CF6F3E9